MASNELCRKSESAFTLRSVFQDGIDKPGLVSDTHHHDDNPPAQATFLWPVESLVVSMSEIGNPFMDLEIWSFWTLDMCTKINQGSKIRWKHSKVTDPCFPPCIVPVKFDTLTWLVFLTWESIYPPSMSNHGALGSGTKSDLLLCVSELVGPTTPWQVNVPEGTWKGTSKYQVTGKSFCV